MTIPTYRNAVAKLRISAHQLLIETGRHRNIDRNDRKCTLCNLDQIEDEFHFILICPFYKDIRENYIRQFYYRKPSMFKLIKLLNCSNINTLNGIGIYYKLANEKRISQLNTQIS